MKRIISSLALSVAVLGTVVAQEAVQPVAKQSKLAFVKKYPKTTTAIVAGLVALGGGLTVYKLRENAYVKPCLDKISGAAQTTKTFVVETTGKASEYAKNHKAIIGGSVAAATVAGLIAADLRRGEKSIIKKAFRNKKAAAQQV